MENLQTPSAIHKNRNNVLRNILASIIGRREKVGINGKTDELNDNALVRRKLKPTPKNNTNNNSIEEMKINPLNNEDNRIGGKPKKSRKSRKTRKNRKSKRKL
jgi:hypothetical protein